MPSNPQDLANPQRYDARSIALHWLTAGLVLVLWCVGQTIDFFPRGAPRVTMRGLHICTGVLLALVFCYRIWWRTTGGVHLPPQEGPKPLQLAARLVHRVLYAAVLTTLALGLANTWVRGDNIFNLFTIPAFDPGNRDLRETVEDLHGLCANLVLIIAGLHAAAALFHHHVLKDTVLRRMWPKSGVPR
jgi:cytochrome b561